MRGIVGREYGRSVSFPISASDIRRWAMAVYYPEPPPAQFWDDHLERDGLAVPEDFNPFAWMSKEGPSDTDAEQDPNQPFVDFGIRAPELKHQVNGGLEVTYGVPMRVGDVITSTTNIAAFSERTGRLGLMLFTTFAVVWTNQNGLVVKSMRKTLIRY
ncbi:MaoC family dehydratase N-terminal domain-containing protein [Nocardia sp. NBC_01377]|uniref:FAS1-like dehydratase domain-containing protein n=1 Tax=Nocardia sp. NBC_01377 TaxID=2903595 RepID=UPI00386C0579